MPAPPETPRISPPSAVPPAELIDFVPARVAFRDVYEPLAWTTLQALGITPSEEIDPRFYNFDRDQLRGWSAHEIEPLRAALVHTQNARTVVAVMETGTTIDLRHRPSLVPFATFFPTERASLPRAPTPPSTRWLEAEEKARIFVCWGDVSEDEARGLFSPFKEEKFANEVTAQEIVCRCIVARGPHTSTSFLLASYPTDNLIWTVGLLNPVPLRRADPVSTSYTAEEWNRRTTSQQGHI